MIPDKDYYADKDGKLTDDPEKFASQIAVAGVFLDEKIARRYGIADTLVSVDEPGAVRRVRGGKASVQIIEADEDKEAEPEKETEPEPKAETPEAKAPEQKPAPKAAAKKGAKNK